MIRWAIARGNPSTVLIRDVSAEVSGQIRWWTWHRGEEQGSWVNHYAYLLSNLQEVVEALFRGVQLGPLERYSESETSWGVIVEHVGFTAQQHVTADGAALAFVGEPYSVVSIAQQVIDGALSKLLGRDVYLARRLAFPGVSATICSKLGVRVHKVAGWKFMGLRTVYRKTQRGASLRLHALQVLDELPARRATPDDIWDDVFEHRPSLYRVVGEINPHLCPEDLIPVIRAKIDRDLGIHRA